MKSRVSIKEVSQALTIVENMTGDQIGALSTGWACSGSGVNREFYTALLPEKVRLALEAIEPQKPMPVSSDKTESEIVPASETLKTTVFEARKRTIYRAQEEKAYAKAELATALTERLNSGGYGQKAGIVRRFCAVYNAGENGSYPGVFKAIGPVDGSGKTIMGWINRLKKNGYNPLCLADSRGHAKRGKRCISEAQADTILSIVKSPLNRPDSPVAELISMAMEKMDALGINTLSKDTYRRWLINDYIPQHNDEWIWWREGDKGLNDKVARSIVRDYTKIAPGDILVADGHVLNFDILNPETGKPKRMTLILFFDMKADYPLGWEIMPTENTGAISAALRRAIIRLGKIPTCVYIDNGRAFKSKYFMSCDQDAFDFQLKGIYARFNIRLIIATPYHGQAKTIERFFREVAGFERIAPTYVGRNIEMKPPRLNRGEKMHRALHETLTHGACPTLEEAHNAIAMWFDKYVHRVHSKSSHIAGLSPAQVMEFGPGVDPSALRELMMVTKPSKIQSNGVYIQGEWYYDQALYGKKHDVFLRYDMQNRESVLVYDAVTEKLICEAFKRRKVHPAAAILGTAEDVAELARQSEEKASLKKRTLTTARELVKSHIIPEVRQYNESCGFTTNNGNVKALPQRSKAIPLLTDAERSRHQRAVDECEVCHVEHQSEVFDDYSPEIVYEDRLDDSYAPVVEMDSEWDRLTELHESDRFERLLEMEIKGVVIPAHYQAWMRYFEQTPMYRNQEAYYVEYRAKMALMWACG